MSDSPGSPFLWGARTLRSGCCVSFQGLQTAAGLVLGGPPSYEVLGVSWVTHIGHLSYAHLEEGREPSESGEGLVLPCSLKFTGSQFGAVFDIQAPT